MKAFVIYEIEYNSFVRSNIDIKQFNIENDYYLTGDEISQIKTSLHRYLRLNINRVPPSSMPLDIIVRHDIMVTDKGNVVNRKYIVNHNGECNESKTTG